MLIYQEPILSTRRILWVLTIPGVCLAACTHHGSTSVDLDAQVVVEQSEIAEPAAQSNPELSVAVYSEPTTEISPETDTSDPVVDTPNEKEERPVAQPTVSINELLALYRRLHSVLDANERSDLITELLSDQRKPLLDLGFELAHRNLSSRTTLSTAVGGVTENLLTSPDPSIRGSAAGLLTRLVTPDAMLRLTGSLNREEIPVAAEPMLLGIARWPNEEATDAVVRWCVRADAPFNAATTAAWAFEQAGLLQEAAQREAILAVLRDRDTTTLQLPALKLFAVLGESADLDRMASLLSDEDRALRDRVAAALVETPRATDLIVQAAEDKPELYASASEAIIRHRPTPAGMRLLAQLQAPKETDRHAMLDRMSDSIELEALGESVALAGLDDQTSSRLLQRLLTAEPPHPPRIAHGLILLAEIELRRGMAVEALNITDTVTSDELDLADQRKLTSIRRQSAVLAGLLDHPVLNELSVEQWIGFYEDAATPEARTGLRQAILTRFQDSLTEEQTALLAVEDASVNEIQD